MRRQIACGDAFIRRFVFAAAICLAASQVKADPPSIAITGVQSNAIQLSVDDLRQMPTQRVRVILEDRKEAEYEGVSVGAVLSRAGVAMGTAIRGKHLANYLLVTARDGYRVVFALPELDPEFTDRVVLLCFARDGAPISPEEGPFRIVITQERRHARWVRQVKELTLKTE